MRNYTARNEDEKGIPANVPFQHYMPSDRIALIKPSRPASMREAIAYINVPGPGETWQQLNEWRASYGLSPSRHQFSLNTIQN